MPVDAATLRDFLSRFARRAAAHQALEGSAVGIATGAFLRVSGIPHDATWATSIAMALVLAAVGGGIGYFIAIRRRKRAAYSVESRAPQCKNLVITADELITHADRATPDVMARVIAQASRIVSQLDIATLLPARRAVLITIGALALWVIPLVAARTSRVSNAAEIRHDIALAVIDRIDATVQAPAYAAQPLQSLHDPSRITALVGSQIHLTVHARAEQVALELVSGTRAMQRTGNETFVADIAADADGFIAMAPSTSNGTAGTRKLVGLSVTPDHAPRVRISAPGKDMYFPDAKHTLAIAAEADDDLGLQTLTLRYTKVSGSGERFTFTEGSVPLNVNRKDEHTWIANASWNLESLDLSPGDMVVYRAVATDKRPGAPASESDAFIAEILAPGGVAAAGFALDPDQERYALSQQMIILKTTRLLAKKSSITTDVFNDEAAQISVEQRRVRAEFVFMMGGELAEEVTTDAGLGDLNEEVEAEGEDDLAAGRMANQGRIALVGAVRAMSRAVQQLNSVDVSNALVSEKAALKSLERAFSHTRILLRALSERERLDLSRRMSGALTDAGRTVEPLPDVAENARVMALRRTLAELAQLAAQNETTVGGRASINASPIDVATTLTTLGEQVLRVDPSSKPLQEIVSVLQQAAGAAQKNDRGQLRQLLDRAAVALTTVVRNDVGSGPSVLPDFRFNQLNGALNDGVRSVPARGAR